MTFTWLCQRKGDVIADAREPNKRTWYVDITILEEGTMCNPLHSTEGWIMVAGIITMNETPCSQIYLLYYVSFGWFAAMLYNFLSASHLLEFECETCHHIQNYWQFIFSSKVVLNYLIYKYLECNSGPNHLGVCIARKPVTSWLDLSRSCDLGLKC